MDAREPQRGLVLPNWEAGDDPAALVDAAVVAEEAGWDGVFLADHLIFPPPAQIGERGTSEPAPFPDPWITLAGIATRTTTLRLGTWITPVPRRQPWQLARDVATLDRLSHGRALLGVGLGRRPDYERFGSPWDLGRLGRQADEALQVIDALWRGEPVSMFGEFYRLDEAVVLPVPHTRPRVPILIGGLWPNKAFLRRGARWDGIIPHFPGDGVLPADGVDPAQHLRDLVAAYRELAEEPGEIVVLDASESSPEYLDACRELGVTWLLTAKREGRWTLDLDAIREGPPRG